MSDDTDRVHKSSNAGMTTAPATNAQSGAPHDPPAGNPAVPLAIEPLLRIGALALLIYACVVLLLPFVSIFVWSVVLTVALYPVFKWTSFGLGGRSRLAAALVTVLALVLVIGPATWLILGLIESVRTISE